MDKKSKPYRLGSHGLGFGLLLQGLCDNLLDKNSPPPHPPEEPDASRRVSDMLTLKYYFTGSNFGSAFLNARDEVPVTVLEHSPTVGAHYAGETRALLWSTLIFLIFNQCQPSMIDVNGWPVVSPKTWFTQFVQLQHRERERNVAFDENPSI